MLQSIVSNPASPTQRSSTDAGHLPVLLAGALICIGIVFAYANSFSVPFLFDDQSSILRNPTLRSLWSLNIFSAPLNATGATGRPVVNASLALNYALGGANVTGYHVINVLVHAANAWLLLSILWRTIARDSTNPDRSQRHLWIPPAAALIWAVHPLQTESVTCVIQRSELLGALFLLLTLYASIRSADSAGRRARIAWSSVAMAACATGMAAKEFVVTAPVLVLLYDRTFRAGSFAAAWRQRRALYIGLAASWLILAAILAQTPQRNHNVGFGLGVSSWDYLLTQCRALALYLKLSIWPHPLVLDYGDAVVRDVPEVAVRGVIIISLLAAAAWAVWARPMLGFVGAWFFIILAPSSSFVPLTTQTIAEHRMYLPLAAVIVLGCLAVSRVIGRLAPILCVAIAVACIVGTHARNATYRTPVSIWSDTAQHAPTNYRAHYNLGNALTAAGQPEMALASFASAVRLKPSDPSIHYNFGSVLLESGRTAEAIDQFQAALANGSDAVDVHVNLGAALARSNRYAEALEQYRRATQLQPTAPDIRTAYGVLLIETGETAAGMRALETALEITPNYGPAHVELGDALLALQRAAEALAHYEAALKAEPSSSAIRERIAVVRQTLSSVR